MGEVKRVTTMPYSKEERETHFWHCELDGNVLSVETSERYYNTKMRKHGWKLVEEGRTPEGKWVYSVYEVPLHALSIRSAEKIKREMTDEQKAAARDRLAKAREKIGK